MAYNFQSECQIVRRSGSRPYIKTVPLTHEEKFATKPHSSKMASFQGFQRVGCVTLTATWAWWPAAPQKDRAFLDSSTVLFRSSSLHCLRRGSHHRAQVCSAETSKRHLASDKLLLQLFSCNSVRSAFTSFCKIHFFNHATKRLGRLSPASIASRNKESLEHLLLSLLRFMSPAPIRRASLAPIRLVSLKDRNSTHQHYHCYYYYYFCYFASITTTAATAATTATTTLLLPPLRLLRYYFFYNYSCTFLLSNTLLLHSESFTFQANSFSSKARCRQ